MIKKIKKIKKKYWIIIGIIILVIAALFFAKNKKNDYPSYKVTKTTVSDELVFAGIVDAERRVDLGFAAGGRVIKNNVKEGDFVKKGQLLAEVDQSAVRAGLIQAKANYQLTKIDTETNANNTSTSYEEQLKEQNTIVENLRQQYISGDLRAYIVDKDDLSKQVSAPIVSGTYSGQEKGKYILDIYSSAANSGYSYTYSGLEAGRESVEINNPGKLGNNGLYIQFPSRVRQNIKWEIPVPNTRSQSYLSRKTAYENALAARSKILSDAKNNVDKLIKNISSSTVSYSDARIKNARAQINASAVRLSDGKIRAPFDAYVVKDNLEVGETVQALNPQITLFANQKKKLILNTPEIYINKIHLGDKVNMTLDAYPDIKFNGHISKIDNIDTLDNGVPVYQTEVIFDDEDSRLRVGMNAHAKIILSKKENVIAIPQHYIQTVDGISKVKVLNNEDKFKERIIKTGFKGNDSLIEVTSGLSLGEVLVLEEN